MYIRNKKILMKTILASNLFCVYNRICQWYETGNQVLIPRTAEYGEQIDPEPELLTFISLKQRNVQQVPGDSMLH